MYIACIVLVLLAGCVLWVGIRLRRLVPKRWMIAQGEWLGPALRFAPHRYRYRTPDGVERVGQTAVQVLWRAPFGGKCLVAYDPEDHSRSHPAQLRSGGTLLTVVGAGAAVCGVVLLVIALS